MEDECVYGDHGGNPRRVKEAAVKEKCEMRLKKILEELNTIHQWRWNFNFALEKSG